MSPNPNNSQLELPIDPPLIWPEPRWHVGQGEYKNQPPFKLLVESAQLVSGVFVGVADNTIDWLNTMIEREGAWRIVLVVIVFPAGPTRERHLLRLLELQTQVTNSGQHLEIHILPMSYEYGEDFRKQVLPPNILQASDLQSGKSWLCIGSVCDFGQDEINLASFNVVFQPDDSLRDNWRRWFEYLFTSAAPLTRETSRIPHLVPAPGELAAGEMWETFETACRGPKTGTHSRPAVDPKTGEVLAKPDGATIDPWDNGKTALDPLAQKLQQIYSGGYLVTVDETTRIKPLTIPVKATLLGQKSERTVGTVTQRQSFSLQILDESVNRAFENCRRVTELIDLLTYPLSIGNRWIPEKGKVFLEREVEARNQKGNASLKAALEGSDIERFIEKKQERIRADLNRMYRELRMGESVPSDKVSEVFDEIKSRLDVALKSRITPRPIYNKLAAPDLTKSAPDDNWVQPFTLMLRSARLFRELITNPYFPRKFNGMSFTQQEFEEAMDILGDNILRSHDSEKARTQLVALQEIENSDKPRKNKCIEIWQMISGTGTDSPQ